MLAQKLLDKGRSNSSHECAIDVFDKGSHMRSVSVADDFV